MYSSRSLFHYNAIMEEMDKLPTLFTQFSKFGQTHRPSGEMSLSNLVKWMMQTNVIPGLVSGVDVCNTFKRKANHKHTVNYRVFHEILSYLSKTTDVPTEEIVMRLLDCGGPKTSRTTKISTCEVVERLSQLGSCSARSSCQTCREYNQCRNAELGDSKSMAQDLTQRSCCSPNQTPKGRLRQRTSPISTPTRMNSYRHAATYRSST